MAARPGRGALAAPAAPRPGRAYVLGITSSSLELTWATGPDLLLHSVIKKQSPIRRRGPRELGACWVMSLWRKGAGREEAGPRRSCEVSLRPASQCPLLESGELSWRGGRRQTLRYTCESPKQVCHCPLLDTMLFSFTRQRAKVKR